MIPKIIHWCWLSNDPVPPKMKRFMDHWHEVLPDYEFMHWNFERFDKSSSRWVSEAFDNKKYAFAADYIRLYALYHYGGIYMDMDVEVLRPFDDFLSLATMMCLENSDWQGLKPEVAVFGAEKHSPWIGECLKGYENRSFVQPDGTLAMTPLPGVVLESLSKAGYRLQLVHSVGEASALTNGKAIPVFPYDYFSPKSYGTGAIERTANTYAIHHFEGTWLPRRLRWRIAFWRNLPQWMKRVYYFFK